MTGSDPKRTFPGGDFGRGVKSNNTDLAHPRPEMACCPGSHLKIVTLNERSTSDHFRHWYSRNRRSRFYTYLILAWLV